MDAADEAAFAFCEAECEQDPPICAHEFRGTSNRCIPQCIDLYLTQAFDNARGCPQGAYLLVECLAENPGACENVKLACQEEWRSYEYCRDGGSP